MEHSGSKMTWSGCQSISLTAPKDFKLPGSAEGAEQGQSSLQPAFHLVALQPGGLGQDKFNWILFSSSCLSQWDSGR